MNIEALTSLVNGEHNTRKRTPCSVGLLLSQVQAEHPDAAPLLQKALDDDSIPATEISSFLTSQGHEVAAYSIRRHRRRATQDGCRCPK